MAWIPDILRYRWHAWQQHHPPIYGAIDLPFLTGLIALSILGLCVLFSADSPTHHLFYKQLAYHVFAWFVLFIAACVPDTVYYRMTPYLFMGGMGLLLWVFFSGVIGKGAQRWLLLGPLHFQPSEYMKCIIPLALSFYLHHRPLPPTGRALGVCALLIGMPAILVIKQPDLGTGLMIVLCGSTVMILAGLSWRWIGKILLLTASFLPIIWHFMHPYQRERVRIFLFPERAPLGSGYHIIQSKIAIGSGGMMGKGWLAGTQSHLQFLPEHSTDFIFALIAEEWGFLGGTALLLLILCITLRGLYLAQRQPRTFNRLAASGLCLTFFFAAFINVSMVTGLLPVVGLPLPLVSYGGSALLVSLFSFGIFLSLVRVESPPRHSNALNSRREA